METNSFYHEILMEHNLHPAHKHPLPAANIVLDGVNPSCGDSIRLLLQIQADSITDAAFIGEGCAVSQASADILCDLIVGKKKEEALALANDFLRMIRVEAQPNETAALGEAEVLRDVCHMPARVKCAVLGWRTLQKALQDSTCTPQ